MSKIKLLPRTKFSTSKSLSIDEFYQKRHNVLIARDTGGLGDILMMRMMFEDFKIKSPNCNLVVACPLQYRDALLHHPYIDKVIDSQQINLDDFIVSYNISTACGKYESRHGGGDKHRSDIWANHCGIELTKHNMHLQLTDEEIEYGKNYLRKIKPHDEPSIIVCPISAISSKSLSPQQIEGVVTRLREEGLFVFGTHHKPIKTFEDLKVPLATGLTLRQWMSVINAADYVLAVDTAALHCAGGLNKPLVGIFTWADGYVYSRYYPKTQVVQFHRNTHPEWTCGPCYLWQNCPKEKINNLKPCLTNITINMIMEKVKTMIKNEQ